MKISILDFKNWKIVYYEKQEIMIINFDID